ncbi:MAG: fibronectin type III domain-containing protein, partial [Tannerellaceae bacterium]|nr:fibronectin type III domain-containing protein [Tannerellaceae bacterium]
DYYTTTREKLVVSLLNRDQQKPVLEVRLRMVITASNGLKIQSKEEINYPTITLDAGIPTRLTQDDLAPYFQYINSQGYLDQGKLPDGLVEFTFQAIEKYTGKVLSAPATGRVWLSSQKPPLLRLPSNNESVAFRDPMNLKFQWEPQHKNISQVEYEFELRELPDFGAAPQSSFPYSPVIHQEQLISTYLLYNVMLPPLEPNKLYGWRVRAIAKDGVDEINLFDNSGYSEIFWFRTQDNCPSPTGLTASLQSRRLDLKWFPGMGNNEFVVQYRAKYGATSDWTAVNTYEDHTSLYDIQRGTVYEYRVGGICTTGAPVFTNTGEITVPTVDSTRLANCGVMPKFDLSNKEPLPELKVGDVVMLSDYPMTVTQVSGSNGHFSGEGWVPVNWLLETKWEVEFSNITVNTDYRLIAGSARAKYDESEGNIANLDDITEGGITSTKNGIIRPEVVLDFSIPENPVFEYSAETGEMTVYDTSGNPQKVEAPKNNEGKLVFPITVQDKDGNIHQVEEETDADGSPKTDANGHPVLKTTNLGSQGNPLPANSLDKKNISTLATVTFQGNDSQYGFDTWNDKYSQISLIKEKYEHIAEGANVYHVPWKYLPVGGNDKVIAEIKIKGKEKDFDRSKVVFSTPQGTVYQHEKNDNGLYTPLHIVAGEEGDVQEIYALYKLSSEKYETLGKLNVVTYRPQNNPLIIVQINGQADKTSLQKRLDEIYNQAGVKWQVTVEDFDYPGDVKDFFDKKSGVWQDYNSKMNDVITAYKQSHSIDSKTSYLFLLNSSGEKKAESAGFMPRGKQFGFVFVNGRSPEQVNTTVAHELGHGRWRLRHPFDDHYGGVFKETETDNLMSYSGGGYIAKWQWDEINDPACFTNPFEGDEGGMYAEKNYMVLEKDGIFFTPSGDPLFLPKGTKIYSPVIDYRFLPDWPVYIFETSAGKYITSGNFQTASPIFYGYKKEGSQKEYYDESSNQPAVGSSVVVTLVKHRSEGEYDRLTLYESEQPYLIPKLSSDNRIPIVEPYTGDIKKVDESNKLQPYGAIIEESVDWSALETELANLNKKLNAAWNVSVIDKDGKMHSLASGTKGSIQYSYNTTTGKWKVTVSGVSNDEVKQIITEAIQKKLDAFQIDENGISKIEKTTTTPVLTEDGGEFRFGDGLHWYEWGSALCDAGTSIYENASLPEIYWNQSNERYKEYPLHTPPTFSGIADGAIEEITGTAQLVKLGLTIVTDKEVAQGIWESAKNITFSSIKEAATGAIKDKWDKYANSPDYVTYHELGKDGVAVASMLYGGFAAKGKKLSEAVEESGNLVKKKADDILEETWQLSKQKLGRAADSKVLGENLEAVGKVRPDNSAAHHIVAGKETYHNAENARK